MKKQLNWWIYAAPPVVAIALSIALTGCGGGVNTTGGAGVGGPPPAVGRTFYSAYNNVLVGSSDLVNVARGFVTLEQNSNKPVAVGIELTAKAIRDLPLPPGYNNPVVYGFNLPAESVYTPFSYAAVSYWSGHDPPGAGDRPHFHPLFGINPPQQPSSACQGFPDPSQCPDEATSASAAETPKDYQRGDVSKDAGIVIAPGIGIAYEDFVLPQPQLLPGWNTIGQNYFFYHGHMNGIGLGATNDYLLKQEQGNAPAVPAAVKNIKQPQVYPKVGFYPRHHDVRWEPTRKVHIFILTDFQQAANVVP